MIESEIGDANHNVLVSKLEHYVALLINSFDRIYLAMILFYSILLMTQILISLKLNSHKAKKTWKLCSCL